MSACRRLLQGIDSLFIFLGQSFPIPFFLKMKNPNNSKAVYIQVRVTVQSQRGGFKVIIFRSLIYQVTRQSQASVGVPKRLKIIFNLRSHWSWTTKEMKNEKKGRLWFFFKENAPTSTSMYIITSWSLQESNFKWKESWPNHARKNWGFGLIMFSSSVISIVCPGPIVNNYKQLQRGVKGLSWCKFKRFQEDLFLLG